MVPAGIVADLASPNVGVTAAAPGLVPKVGMDEDPKPGITDELPPVAGFTAGDNEDAFGWVVSGVDPNLGKVEGLDVPKLNLVVAPAVVVGVIPNAGAEIEGLVTTAFRLRLADGCGLKLNWEGAFDVSANPVFVVDVAAAVTGADRADARNPWPT